MNEKPPELNKKPPQPSFEAIKKWGRIATIVVASFVAGHGAYEKYEDIRYDHYLEETFNQSKKAKIQLLISDLRSKMGDVTIDHIEHADQKAFFEREKRTKKVEIDGFEQIGISDKVARSFLSGEVFFPKNWIDGQVDRIEYLDKNIPGTDIFQSTAGQLDQEKNTIYFYRESDQELTVDEKKNAPWYFKGLLGHESGHANDWETDRDLNLLERLELLNDVLSRMQSKNPYQSPEGRRGKPEYWKNSLFKVSDYWAEICSEYFSDPVSLKEKFPEDFNLVNNVVLKQDPSFDVFKVGGPYFDTRTGQLLPKWKAFMAGKMVDK